MSAWADIVKGIRDTIALNDRVAALAAEVDAMDGRAREMSERLVRVETFCDLLRPAAAARLALPPNRRE